MGQCYYVELKLNIDNEAKFIAAANWFMKNRTDARFIDTYKPDSVDNIARIILVAQQNGFEKKDEGYYISEFDASYGWEGLLADFFTAVKHTLLKGSYITVYPDSGHWTEEV